VKLSCKEVSFRVSESLDRNLTLRERLAVKIHLIMCKACQQMAQQMKLLRSTALRYSSTADTHDQKELPEEARQRILKALHRENDHHHE